MSVLSAQEIVDKLTGYGEYDGHPEKQLYRTSLNGFTVLLEHPTMKTAVDADGNPVNSDENLKVKGRRFVPRVVELPAQNIDNYLKKGFKIPKEPQDPAVAGLLPPATDPELEALSKSELRDRAEEEGVTIVKGDSQSRIISRILAHRENPEEDSGDDDDTDDTDADTDTADDLSLSGGDELDGMTIAELKTVADDEDIVLAGGERKAEIINAIRSARA